MDVNLFDYSFTFYWVAGLPEALTKTVFVVFVLFVQFVRNVIRALTQLRGLSFVVFVCLYKSRG